MISLAILLGAIAWTGPFKNVANCRAAESVSAATEAEIRQKPAFKSPLAGYTYRSSYTVGESVSVAFAARADRRETLTLDRIVIVNAHTSRRIKEIPLAEQHLAVPKANCESHLGKGCGFPGSVTLSSEGLAHAPYFLTLVDNTGAKSDPIFVLLKPAVSERAKLSVAVVYPTATWQAYNQIGGGSFYTPNPSRRYELSLLRPITHRTNLSTLHAGSYGTLPFLKPLDELSITYYGVTSEDLDEDYALIKDAQLVLITGHDEYWSRRVRNHLERYVNEGGKLAVFSGNVGWWLINYEDQRIYVNKGSKHKEGGPVYEGTGLPSKLGRPEEAFTGMSWRFGGYPLKRKSAERAALAAGLAPKQYASSTGMIVRAAEHPIFQDSSLKPGDYFGVESEVMAVEVDGVPLSVEGGIDRVRAPALPLGLQVLAEAHCFNPQLKAPNIDRVGIIAEYRNDFGGHVMHFGSIGWCRSLRVGDPLPTRIFKNAMRYMLKRDLGTPNGKADSLGSSPKQ